MAEPMTDDALKALTDAEMRNGIGYYGGKLAEQRRKAEYYYLGLAKGDLSPPEVDGRSNVVSTDVRNVVESMLPQIMVKFVGGDSVVEFEPTKPGDEEKAQLCTDYLNYLFFKQNNGHKIAYTWFKDALLQKNGIIKVWWDARNEETREEYRGLDDVELAQVLDDEEVEVIEQKTYPDEEDAEHRAEAVQKLTESIQQAMLSGQMENPQAVQAVSQMRAQLEQIQAMPPKMLYDVAFKRTKNGGKVCIENVPPEEFIISRKAKNIATSPFVGHRVARTVSELRSMGYKNVDNLSGDDQATALNAEKIERLSFDDEQAYLQVDQPSNDPSQKVIWITECYVRCDYDGDGIAELRKVVRAGNEILENEAIDIAPFVSITPIPLPHKFFGLSIADVAMESQRIKTNLLRARLDNLYLQVNGRYFAVEGQVNLDDLLTSRPGGVVRIKGPGAVGRLDQSVSDNTGAEAMQAFMEDFLENSTGWSRYSQGTDAGSLNKTATGINIITNKADMRLDLIARNFAEGFVELFRQMLKLVTQYQDGEREVRIAGNFLSIDPREWRNQFDVSINVGLGMGNKDQMAQHMMALMQVQAHGLQIGTATPENVFNASTELAKNMGYKNADKFFTDPSKQPPRQSPPDPAMLELQADQQRSQAELQLRQQEQQTQAQIEAHRNEMEAQREAMKAHHDMELARLKAESAERLELLRMESEKEAQIAVARIRAEASIIVAGMAQKANESAALAAATQGFVANEEPQP